MYSDLEESKFQATVRMQSVQGWFVVILLPHEGRHTPDLRRHQGDGIPLVVDKPGGRLETLAADLFNRRAINIAFMVEGIYLNDLKVFGSLLYLRSEPDRV